MAGISVFSSDTLVKVCIICESRLPEKYMSIFGCKHEDDDRFCESCKDRNHCSVRLISPDDEDITGGICPDCLKERGL